MDLIAPEFPDQANYSLAPFNPMAGKPASDNGYGSANAARAMDVDRRAAENDQSRIKSLPSVQVIRYNCLNSRALNSGG